MKLKDIILLKEIFKTVHLNEFFKIVNQICLSFLQHFVSSPHKAHSLSLLNNLSQCNLGPFKLQVSGRVK